MYDMLLMFFAVSGFIVWSGLLLMVIIILYYEWK